ncbi:hypothetical protein QJQ45_017484 [Haematococcus lacustris]|nr:hypothetical protein QJQ45_017484 [Haematococcus lacustris]
MLAYTSQPYAPAYIPQEGYFKKVGVPRVGGEGQGQMLMTAPTCDLLGIGTRGGWGAKAVLKACRKVVERPNNGRPTDRLQGKAGSAQRKQGHLSASRRKQGQLSYKLPPALPVCSQVQHCLLRLAWSKRLETPVRGLMWCPKLAQATPCDIGKWVDRDCNATLNLQRIGEGPWRPLKLCRWQHQAPSPSNGKEYPTLGFEKLQDRAPKTKAQQPVAQ